MKVYIICPVREAHPSVTKRIRAYVEQLAKHHEVHFPPDNAPQYDPTGRVICETHLRAMQIADEVHVFWDVDSKGSHFDLGMAYALGKTIRMLECLNGDIPGKSYWKAMGGGEQP